MSPVVAFLLQISVIVLVARAFGALFRRIRQPFVVGEMVAGLVLGPSVLGQVLPTLHAALFAAGSHAALNAAAQIGVLLFMFAVGTRVELGVFRRQSRAIAAITAAGIAVPFLLGAALAVWLHGVFAASVPRTPFVLFIATAMSVTAFPVLARIIVERRLEGTVPGNTALVCAAITDLIAWVLVAAVVGLVSERTVSAAVHGVFLAFAAGVACGAVSARVVRVAARLEVPAAVLFLPVFFAVTGLRTDLRLLAASAASWLWGAAIIVTATAGKFGATAAAARLMGMARADAMTIGALMNTRGLMELVVLTIGYELKLLPPEVFAMMVAMTLVTTCAAGPLVERWSPRYASASAVAAP